MIIKKIFNTITSLASCPCSDASDRNVHNVELPLTPFTRAVFGVSFLYNQINMSAADMPISCALNWNILFALFERDVYLDATKPNITGHQDK